MAKYKRKIQTALEARRKSFDTLPDKYGVRRPGSQNRKKGYGKGSNSR